MMNRLNADFGIARYLAVFCVFVVLPVTSGAQVPVDEDGQVIGDFEAVDVSPATGDEEIPLLSEVDLGELVGPIALYPDDLLAIVLPASAYPLQIIEVARFIEQLEEDPSLEPNPEWDDSVVALTNYPEVVELLNGDIDWTWRLGEAVVAQQADVVAAIETFRDRAYAAGNLKSDSYQTVSRDDGVIEITPVAEDTIYVPYYEPDRVVVYQPRPVYYYYPRPYPVYYYPYPSWHAFNRGYFWGVTTAFTIGWYSDSLNVFHHSYHGHPYYGHSYWDRWWYRRPSINIYNNHYVGRNTTVTVNHYNRGDRWRPRSDRRNFSGDRRITRNRYNPDRRESRPDRRAPVDSNVERRTRNPGVARRTRDGEPIVFRDRPRTPTIKRSDRAPRTDRQSDRRGAAGGRSEPVADSRSRITPATPRTRTAPTRAQRQPRRATEAPVRRDASPVERRQDATPRSRPPATSARAGRVEAARQVRRPNSTAQTRAPQAHAQPRRVVTAERAAPARQTRRAVPVTEARRAEPVRQVSRRSTPAPKVRRSEPARPVAAARQQQAPSNKSRTAEGRRQHAERQLQRRR